MKRAVSSKSKIAIQSQVLGQLSYFEAETHDLRAVDRSSTPRKSNGDR